MDPPREPENVCSSKKIEKNDNVKILLKVGETATPNNDYCLEFRQNSITGYFQRRTKSTAEGRSCSITKNLKAMESRETKDSSKPPRGHSRQRMATSSITTNYIIPRSTRKSSIPPITRKEIIPRISIPRPPTYVNPIKCQIQHLIKHSNKERNQSILSSFQHQKSPLHQHSEIEKYEIGHIIGKGAFAEVKSGKLRSTGETVAMKVYNRYRLLHPHRKANIEKEIAILRQLNHPRVVRLLDVIEHSRKLVIVQEMIKGKSLHRFQKQQPQGRISEIEALQIFKQIVEGIVYCHANNVCHRDLKLENILMNSDNNVKIIDFGFAVMVQKNIKLKTFCGTPSYMPPEIVAKHEYFGPPADLWSLGVMLYAMVCGCYPFQADSECELYRRIAKGDFFCPSYVSKRCRDLFNQLIQVKPDRRATAVEILKTL